MSKFSRIVATVTILAGLGFSSGAALAAEACGSMLMPAAQLKQVSRGFSSHHSGVDLTAPYGSPVRAADAGTVIFAGTYFGYGNMIDLRHDDGTVTRYGHLSRFAKGLHIGTNVAMGEQIGAIGTSGYAHGAHLHFEVRIDGRPVDPEPYLALAQCPTGPSGPSVEEARAPESRAPVVVVAEPEPEHPLTPGAH